MRAIDIENWALRVLDRVQKGIPLEDSRVELKTTWIRNANHVARQIAGHCNAGAGDNILWLIGVDESKGITGVAHQDMAKWWPEVAAQFDEHPPAVNDVAVPYHGHVVVALVFETDRVPFVVRNASHGKQGGGGGPVEREVPWREGTSIRSAKRSDLIRLLVPVARLPRLEIHNADAELSVKNSDHGTELKLHLVVTVYAIVPLGAAVALPNHQTHGVYAFPERNTSGRLGIALAPKSESVSFFLPISKRHVSAPKSTMHTVHEGDGQILIDGPGFFRFICTADLSHHTVEDWSTVGPLHVTIQTRPAGGDLSTTAQTTLTPCTAPDNQSEHGPEYRWRLTGDQAHVQN